MDGGDVRERRLGNLHFSANVGRHRGCKVPRSRGTTRSGSSARTRQTGISRSTPATYVATSGSLPIQLNATNAAGTGSSPIGVVPGRQRSRHGVLQQPERSEPDPLGRPCRHRRRHRHRRPLRRQRDALQRRRRAGDAYPTAGRDRQRRWDPHGLLHRVQQRGRPARAAEHGTSSIAIHIDEAPPSLTFEPRNPSDPTGLVVDASDSESGVAGGSIEMAPAGTSNWTSLPTTFDGSHLLAHFDDADLIGTYTFRATPCDNVGNCASASEVMALPVRTASDCRGQPHEDRRPAPTSDRERAGHGSTGTGRRFTAMARS